MLVRVTAEEKLRIWTRNGSTHRYADLAERRGRTAWKSLIVVGLAKGDVNGAGIIGKSLSEGFYQCGDQEEGADLVCHTTCLPVTWWKILTI